MKTPLDGFGEALAELGKKRDDIVVLSADTAKYVKTFAHEHPERFLQCGKAEQSMISMAAGLAEEEKTPFALAQIGKNYDQIRAACQKKLDIKIAGNEAEDIALARTLPLTIIAPADYHEAKKATIAAATMNGPVYIKLHENKTTVTNAKSPFTVGRVEIMRAGKDCTIVSFGLQLHEALKAAEILSRQEIECTVLNCHTIKPLDKHALISSAKITGCIVIAEEETGLSGAAAEVLIEHSPMPMKTARNQIEIVRATKEAIMQRSQSICPEIPEEHGKMLYPEINPQFYFKLRNGGAIKSIPGLHKALLGMSNETFSHHCNSHKNDFSTWIKDVFKERTLAKALEKAHTRVGMALVIARWLG